MRANHNKKSIASVTALCMALALFIISGCGSDSSSPAVQQYAGKVSYIGDLSGTLSDEIDEIFANSVPSDGSSADLPLFIAAQSVLSLTEDQKQRIRDTFANGRPIVIMQGGAPEINALYTILGLEMTYTLPEGLPEGKQYAELFAIDKESDNDIFVWSIYPPNEGAPQTDGSDASLIELDFDSAEDQFDRAEMFLDWINIDTRRDEVMVNKQAYKADANRAFAAAAGGNAELTSVANSVTYTKVYNIERGNNYTINYHIYSCHSINAADAVGYDWFYVQQEAHLNAKKEYKGIKDWYLGRATDEIHHYTDRYMMDNRMDKPSNSELGVRLMRASPVNENTSTTVTSGVNFNIGGTIGFSPSGPTGSGTLGISIINTKSVNVKDCEVLNRCDYNEDNNASWTYTFKKPSVIYYIGYRGLTEPPELSRGLFEPVNQWIWQFAPAVRERNQDWFQSHFQVYRVQSVGQGDLPDHLRSYGGSIFMPPENRISKAGSWIDRISLPFLPLLVANQNITLPTGAAGAQGLNFTAWRNWTATSSNPEWCTVEPGSGTPSNPYINISFTENNTGKSRSAVITYTIADSTGKNYTTSKNTTTVFQPSLPPKPSLLKQ